MRAAARGGCRRSRRPRRRASSPPVQWAPVPASVTSPPTMKLGASPASARISMSIDVVVVLPCVPATADRAGLGADRRPASRPGAASGCRARGPRASSMLCVGDRRRRRDGVAARRRSSASWPTWTSTPAARTRSSTGWSRRSLPDTCVAHLGEGDGDRATCPGPPTPTTCRRRGRDRSSGAPGRGDGREHGRHGAARLGGATGR